MAEEETWNMATATMKRLDFLLRQSSYFSQSLNLVSWFHTLMDLRRNLYPFMGDTIEKEVDEKLKEIPGDWRATQSRVNPAHFSKVNQIFDELYIIFIKLMKAKGLLMPKAVDAGKAVIEM